MSLDLLQLGWRLVRDGFALYGASFHGTLPHAFAERSDDADCGQRVPPVPHRSASDRANTQSKEARLAVGRPTDFNQRRRKS
jgi:hypothetical protein